MLVSAKLTGVVVAFAVEVELDALTEVSLTMLLFISIESGLMVCCDMTIGCGAVAFEALIIGLICVDPTFIVGVAECCIALPTLVVFRIFANDTKKNSNLNLKLLKKKLFKIYNTYYVESCAHHFH